MGNSELFTIQPLPGRGLGVVANDNISRGTQIISEDPLLTVQRDTNDIDSVRDSIKTSLKSLNSDQQRAFFSLFNTFEGDPVLNIARTNALPLGSNATQGAIFIQSARINHSCNPNSQNTWNDKLHQLTIYAVQDIKKGEEITITYLDGVSSFEKRQSRLLQSFRFTCACELCSLSVPERRKSDKRREMIAALDNSIGDGVSIVAAPLSCLGKAHEMLVLMQEEGISGPDFARLYYDALQIVIAHGDQARAKVFAQRARSERVACEGADSPEIPKLDGLAEDPTSHRLYGTSKKWASLPSDIPSDLSEPDFEDWLWRKKKWLRA